MQSLQMAADACLHRFNGVMGFFDGIDFYKLCRMWQQKLIDYL